MQSRQNNKRCVSSLRAYTCVLIDSQVGAHRLFNRIDKILNRVFWPFVCFAVLYFGGHIVVAVCR